MDGQSYLNQISQQVRPEKKSGGGLLGSRLFLLLIGAVVVIIGIIVMSSFFTGGTGGVKNQSISLKLHIDGTLNAINTYQNNVKSSLLRSSSASLASVLSNTNRELTEFLVNNYKYKDGAKEYSKLIEKANANKDTLANDLFNAKISGTLDRVYAHKMNYEIELLMAEETKLYNESSNETLKELLSNSYNSLDNLHQNFDDFSESK